MYPGDPRYPVERYRFGVAIEPRLDTYYDGAVTTWPTTCTSWSAGAQGEALRSDQRLIGHQEHAAPVRGGRMRMAPRWQAWALLLLEEVGAADHYTLRQRCWTPEVPRSLAHGHLYGVPADLAERGLLWAGTTPDAPYGRSTYRLTDDGADQRKAWSGQATCSDPATNGWRLSLDPPIDLS